MSNNAVIVSVRVPRKPGDSYVELRNLAPGALFRFIRDPDSPIYVVTPKLCEGLASINEVTVVSLSTFISGQLLKATCVYPVYGTAQLLVDEDGLLEGDNS